MPDSPLAPSPKRVLILSASAGAGHVRAADALLKDFQQHPAVASGGDCPFSPKWFMTLP